MRTSRVRWRILSVPYHAPDKWSGGENRGLTTVLVFVDTDDVSPGSARRTATAALPPRPSRP